MNLDTNMTWGGALLIYVPIVLFVVAFLYETWLSFRRLRPAAARKQRSGYVDATWEITHTLLVFAVVMFLMLYTQAIDELAAIIYWPTFAASLALGLRAMCYLYIFYVRRDQTRRGAVDWVFALSHVVAAALLVTVVLQVSWFILTSGAPVNTQFIPVFLPGLALVVAVSALPVWVLYRQR